MYIYDNVRLNTTLLHPLTFGTMKYHSSDELTQNDDKLVTPTTRNQSYFSDILFVLSRIEVH